MYNKLFPQIESGKHPKLVPPPPTYKGSFKYQSSHGSKEQIYFIQTSIVVINQDKNNSEDEKDNPIILRWGLAFRVFWQWNGYKWEVKCEAVYNEPCIKTRKMTMIKVK